MAIPDFEMIMLPLLEGLHENEAQNINIIEDRLAGYFELTEEALNTMDHQHQQTVFQQNIATAIDHLKKADLINESNEGATITGLGKQVVHRRLNGIDVQYLRRLPGYLE